VLVNQHVYALDRFGSIGEHIDSFDLISPSPFTDSVVLNEPGSEEPPMSLPDDPMHPGTMSPRAEPCHEFVTFTPQVRRARLLL
jgi:hypothetical protein